MHVLLGKCDILIFMVILKLCIYDYLKQSLFIDTEFGPVKVFSKKIIFIDL